MTRWKSVLGVALAALVLPTVLSGQQGPLRHPIPRNTWKDWVQPPAPSTAMAVRAGRLFDSKSGQMLTKQVVIMLGERITDVGPEGRIAIPAGARVIDLSRATVMPGFIDGHSHVFESAPEKGQTQLDVAFIAAASARTVCFLRASPQCATRGATGMATPTSPSGTRSTGARSSAPGCRSRLQESGSRTMRVGPTRRAQRFAHS